MVLPPAKVEIGKQDSPASQEARRAMTATARRAKVVIGRALRQDLNTLEMRQRELRLLGDAKAATHLEVAMEAVGAARKDLVDGDA